MILETSGGKNSIVHVKNPGSRTPNWLTSTITIANKAPVCIHDQQAPSTTINKHQEPSTIINCHQHPRTTTAISNHHGLPRTTTGTAGSQRVGEAQPLGPHCRQRCPHLAARCAGRCAASLQGRWLTPAVARRSKKWLKAWWMVGG